MNRTAMSIAAIRRLCDSLWRWGVTPTDKVVDALAALGSCTAEEFASVVWQGEGLDPTLVDLGLYRQVLGHIRFEMERAALDELGEES